MTVGKKCLLWFNVAGVILNWFQGIFENISNILWPIDMIDFLTHFLPIT